MNWDKSQFYDFCFCAMVYLKRFYGTTKNNYSEGYHFLCESLNVYGDSNSIIKKTEYAKGNCFFCFNLMPDKGCNEQYNTIKTGNFQIKLNFKEQIEKKLRLISIMEYDMNINTM